MFLKFKEFLKENFQPKRPEFSDIEDVVPPEITIEDDEENPKLENPENMEQDYYDAKTPQISPTPKNYRISKKEIKPNKK